VVELIVRCGRDWTLASGAEGVLRWVFPGTIRPDEWTARTAEAAQAAERFEYERIRSCISAHRMTGEQHRLYAASKGEYFTDALPDRWVGLPALFLTDTQLGDRPVPRGLVERVRASPSEALLHLIDSGVIELW